MPKVSKKTKYTTREIIGITDLYRPYCEMASEAICRLIRKALCSIEEAVL